MESQYQKMVSNMLEETRRNNVLDLTCKEFRKFKQFIEESVEKNIEMKPILKSKSFGFSYQCPFCQNESSYSDLKEGSEYCPDCGQKIDWGKRDNKKETQFHKDGREMNDAELYKMYGDYPR